MTTEVFVVNRGDIIVGVATSPGMTVATAVERYHPITGSDEELDAWAKGMGLPERRMTPLTHHGQVYGYNREPDREYRARLYRALCDRDREVAGDTLVCCDCKRTCPDVAPNQPDGSSYKCYGCRMGM